MENITSEQLRWLIETQLTEITLKCADGKKAVIEPQLYLTVNWQEIEDRARRADEGEELEPYENNLKCGGYITRHGKTEHKSKKYDTLIKHLEKIGAITPAGIKLQSISGAYNTLKQYKKRCEFLELDNAGIIEKYAQVADEFELVAPYCPYEYFDSAHPNGTVKLSDEDCETAKQSLRENTFKNLRALYDKKLTEKQKAALPSFKELCDEIISEFDEHLQKAKDGLLEENESPYLCDLLYDGKVKYPKPESVMWQFYQEIDMMKRAELTAEQMKDNDSVRPLDSDLNTPPLMALKPHLISVTPTFRWHCTVSGMLHKVFRFKLNDSTLEWLKAGEYGNLEDLAFYNGDKLLYSECTHEGIREDLSDD